MKWFVARSYLWVCNAMSRPPEKDAEVSGTRSRIMRAAPRTSTVPEFLCDEHFMRPVLGFVLVDAI